MGTDDSERRSLAIELQTSASLVDAALRLLTEHWPELSDDRRRQVLEAARERAHHVAQRLDQAVGRSDSENTAVEAPGAPPLHEVE
jgi:hypothetical protein